MKVRPLMSMKPVLMLVFYLLGLIAVFCFFLNSLLKDGTSQVFATNGSNLEDNALQGINDSSNQETVAKTLNKNLYKVAESEVLILYFDVENHAVVVMDKRNNHIWSSAADIESYGIENVNERILSRMTTLFEFKYTNTTNNKYAIVIADYTLHKPEIKYDITSNGIKMYYRFSKLGISIQVNIFLDGNILTVQIPADSILEDGDFNIISIDLMPFFGSSSNKEEGYMFYPDGCGALHRFKHVTGNKTGRASFYIYGGFSVFICNGGEQFS